MLALLLGILLAVPPPDSAKSLEDCLALGPERTAPPITSLGEAQKTWFDESISRDTLRVHLSRIRRARRCYQSLDPSRIERPFLDNIMETYDAEADLRAGLRQFTEAFNTYDQALSYLRSPATAAFANRETLRAAWSASLHQQQGYLHYLLGNLSNSIEHYLRAFETSADPAGKVEHLLNLGILHQRIQDYRSTRDYYRRAQERLRNGDLPPDERNDLLTFAYLVQGDLLLEQTLNTEFDRSLLRRARDNARKGRSLAEPGTERHARLSSVLSESLGYLGAFDEAYRLNDEVQRYSRTHDDPRLQILARLKRGVLHLQTERWARADEVLHEALARADELGDLDYQRRILRALGRLYEMQHEWAAAERYYRKGVSVIEDYRRSLTASQWSMTAFAQWRDVHRGLVRVLLAQDRDRAALAALDRSRARHLRDLRSQARIVNQLAPSARARYDSLTHSLTSVRNRLGQADLSAQSESDLKNREVALMAARQQLLHLDTTSTRPTISDVQATLADQNRALVSYFLDAPWPVYERSPRSAAFVLTGDTLRTVSLSGVTQDSVRAHLESISPVFTTRGKPTQANAMHFDLRPLHRLHEALYAPVAPHLPERRPLTVVPSGPLFQIPYSMLVRSMPGGRYAPAEARFVLHERPTTLELSTSLVVDSSRADGDRSPNPARLAAFGVSSFDRLQSVPTTLRAALPRTPFDSSFSLPALPGVRDELRAVQRRVDGAQVYLDDNATEGTFREESRRANVLHLASHAFVHPTSPLHNAFLLRPDSGGTDTDGILFLHELRTQNRPLSLVVLSGCNTGRGTHRGGEGMEGLQYAFRAMGAEATLASLWPVADAANVELIDAFYQHLRSGLRKDEALRRAKLDYLEDHPRQASPFFWAPTVLYGSPTPPELTSSSLPSGVWWGLGLLGVVGGLFLLWWWRRKRRTPRLT